MIPDWEKAISFVLKMEGGEEVETNPNDPGGMTKFGISKKAYPNVDIANLTKEQAMEIYKNDYWMRCRCDELPTPWAIGVFDSAVNQGVGKAARIMQAALGVVPDGVIGEKTIAAAYAASPRVLRVFLARRQAAYIDTILGNPNLNTWAINWSFRVLALSELIFPTMPNNVA